MRFLHAYRTIVVPANIVSVIACIVALKAGSLSMIFLLFWMKLITTLFLVTFIYLFNRQVIYFFMNLGIGERRFYIGIVSIDLLLFIFMMSITFLIK